MAQFNNYKVLMDSIGNDISKFQSIKMMPYADWCICENKRRVSVLEKTNKNDAKI